MEWDDPIAGAIFDSTTATRSGAAYIVFGPLSAGSATTINTIADAKFVGEGSATTPPAGPWWDSATSTTTGATISPSPPSTRTRAARTRGPCTW